MAEPYFNHSEAYDLGLLRIDVREETGELGRIAREAEADCIEWYTVSRNQIAHRKRLLGFEAGTVYVVALDGYAEDAAEADGYAAARKDWTGFANAFRQAIARVISHRLRYLDDDPTVTSKTEGAISETRERGGLNPRWPKHWDRGLTRYDLREGAYHI